MTHLFWQKTSEYTFVYLSDLLLVYNFDKSKTCRVRHTNYTTYIFSLLNCIAILASSMPRKTFFCWSRLSRWFVSTVAASDVFIANYLQKQNFSFANCLKGVLTKLVVRSIAVVLHVWSAVFLQVW